MSIPLSPNDPSYWMLEQGRKDPSKRSTPEVHDPSCYICNDPEFAMMGLPLCKACPRCSASQDGERAGHIPADDVTCTVCGFDLQDWYERGRPANG